MLLFLWCKEAVVDMDGGAIVDMNGEEQKEFEVTGMDPEISILKFGDRFYARAWMAVDKFVRAPGFYGMNAFLPKIIWSEKSGPKVEITEEPNVFNCDPQDHSS